MTMLEKVFKVLGEQVDGLKTTVLEKEDFKTQGYIIQSAKGLELPGEAFYLFVAGPVEFFLKNAEDLKPYPEVEGDEAKEIILKIKEQEKNAEAGFGMVMG